MRNGCSKQARAGCKQSCINDPASERLEIICLVEHSHLPVRRTLRRTVVFGATLHSWSDRNQDAGPDGLGDQTFRPGRPPDTLSGEGAKPTIVTALEAPKLSPRK